MEFTRIVIVIRGIILVWPLSGASDLLTGFIPPLPLNAADPVTV